MPTPALSFAVRDLKCSGGVVITASHNPAKYNGYKVYGPDGCQITTQAAKEIQKEIDAVDPLKMCVEWILAPLSRGDRSSISMRIRSTVIWQLLEQLLSCPKALIRASLLCIRRLNGTGVSCVPRCLKEHGFTRLIMPEEQDHPDGHFPTCPYPNPEIREALDIGLQLAQSTKSDLLLATDPDCDRVGAAVREDGKYTLITGNEMGVLLFDFICKMRMANGTMPENPIAVKTIVTTPMAAKIAEHYGVELIDVLTGFKFIGEQIGLLEKKNEAGRYIFGFEESYGYLSGTYVRDKDAVNASLLICEMFAWYRSQGKSLVDALQALYSQYGYYQSRLLSFEFTGAEGFEAMQKFMEELRINPPAYILDMEVMAVGDYLHSCIQHQDGQREAINLPSSNVLRFWLKGDSQVVVRPSGTEPKLKVYVTTVADTCQASSELAARLANDFEKRIRRSGEPSMASRNKQG